MMLEIKECEVVLRQSASLLQKLRTVRPLIHNITNHVVMNFTANALLAVGASPAMVHAVEEVEEFVVISQALVINIGTIDAGFLKGMELASAKASELKIPWIFDPVGVGATKFRNDASISLLKNKPSVVRGNAGEIISLANITGSYSQNAKQKGVDSISSSNDAAIAAKALSLKLGTIVVCTGEVDFLCNGEVTESISGGSSLSQDVTGTGCMTTALIGAFLGVAPPFEACIAGLSLMKTAAKLAAQPDIGIGEFKTRLLDSLYFLSSSVA